MTLTCRAAVLLLLALAAAWPAAAQVVRGTVVEAGSGTPVAGALVALLDAQGRQRDGSLTDAAGSYALQAPGEGVYRVRAERVGQRTAVSRLLPLAAGAVREVALEMDPDPVSLVGIEARAGRRRCDVRPREGAQTAALWEEARKALTGAAWAEEEQVFRYEATQYRRELDPSLRVVSDQRSTATSVGRHFFTSVPVHELKEKGFVHETPEGTLYYAPDAAVLLSDSFLDDHCFRVEEESAENPGLVGLAFEPVRGRRLPDIRGVLWLDRRTAELRYLEYGYTNLRQAFPTDRLGGRVEFERLPTGAWIVRRWWIRTPAVRVETQTRRTHEGTGMQQYSREVLAGIREDGGEVTSVLNRDGSPVRSVVRAALAGVVFDSTHMAPLAGATVFVSGTSHSATTDEQGRFRMDGVPEGRYLVSFLHPVLDSLSAVAAPREAEVGTAGVVEVRLAVPAVRLAERPSRPDPAAPAAEVGGADRPVPVEGMEGRARARSARLAEFHRRAGSGGGRYVTAEQIDRLKPVHTAEIFRSIPSFDVVGTRVRLRMAGAPTPTGLSAFPRGSETMEPATGLTGPGGQVDNSPQAQQIRERAGERDRPADCVPALFLDGVPFEPVAGDLGEIRPGDIEGIEVYARSSLAPAQYRGRNTDCGIILIWLKESIY